MTFDTILLLFCIICTISVFIWMGLVARQVNVSKGIDKMCTGITWMTGIGVLASLLLMWGGYVLFITA